MPDLPRLDRTLHDPWLPARLAGEVAILRAELAIDDVTEACLVLALAEARRLVLGLAPSAALTAATPPDPTALEAARRAWESALGEYLRPVLEEAYGDRWRAILAQAQDRESDEVLARLAHLTEVPDRLVEPYWRDQLARIGRAIDDVFDDIRGELLAGQAGGESVDMLRDRVARVLQLDAGSAELRARIADIEGRLFNTALDDATRAALWARRDAALHDLFQLRGRIRLAAGKLRLAEALAARAERTGDAELARRVRRLRSEARRLQPPEGAVAGVEGRLSSIDGRLFRNPALTDEEYATLSAERRGLYQALHSDESGWHYKARRIARTETIGSLNAGSVAAAQAVEEAGGDVAFKQWLSTPDERVRPEHAVAEGQVVGLRQPFTVGGELLQYPGDPAGSAGNVINCRCTTLLLAADEANAYDAMAPAPRALTAAQEAPMSEATPEAPLPTGWRGPLAPLDTFSGDDRIIATPAELRLRQPPMPLLYQPALAMGHDAAVVAGRIDRAWIEDGVLWGEGPYDLGSDGGREAARQLAAGMSNGVSVDLDDTVVEVRYVTRDGDAISPPLPDDEDGWGRLISQLMEGDAREVVVAVDWRLMGATQVAHPAFDEARITPVPDYQPQAVPAGVNRGGMVALSPAAAEAQILAAPGGDPAEQLHVTLAFLGDDAASFSEQLTQAAHSAASDAAAALPVTATVAGYGVLGDADPPATVLFLNGDGLAELQDRVLAGLGDGIPDQHEPFIPHLTLGYGLDPALAAEYVGMSITLDTVDVHLADEVTPYGGQALGLVASGVVFPAAAFDDPHLDGPTGLQVTDDGRVFGHLATWGTCHVGFDVCVQPPHSAAGYGFFHVGAVSTDAGELPVGKITLGGGHADPRAGVRAATEHYDEAGAAVAVVRAGEDEHGVWVAGQLLPDVSDDQITRLCASPLSGDWRRVNGNLELVAALAVNVPGFPVPRAVAASGRQVSLVAAGSVPRPRTAPNGADLEDRLVARVRAEMRAEAARGRRANRLARRLGRTPNVRAAELAARIGRHQED